jgi:hypothetical protein
MEADIHDPEASSSSTRKRARADRAAKLKARKGTVETVVKASLLKHLRGDRKHELRHAIQARVEVFSKRYHLASVALMGMLKECFHGAEDVTAVALPDLTCQTFFRQLMLGVQGTLNPNPFVAAYYQAHPQLAAKLPAQRHPADSNIYSAGAKKYMTSLRNHLVLNFKSRLRNFLDAFQSAEGLTDEQRVWMLFKICGWNLPADVVNVPQQPAMLQTVEQHRHILGLTTADASVTLEWLDSTDNLHHLLRHAVHVCRYLETKHQPVFNIVPIAKRRAHFIAIDTYVLYGLLKELGMTSNNEKVFVDMAAEEWEAFFEIAALRGNGREFTRTVESDGISVCVHFTRPKTPQDKTPVVSAAPGIQNPLADMADRFTIIGNDPGRCNIYSMALETPDGRVKSWTLTRRRYYAESGILDARRQSEVWQKALQQYLQQLAAASSKGMDLEAHNHFLDALIHTHDTLWAEYLKPRWARQRLRLYGGKKKLFATFFNGVAANAAAAEGKPVVVAYGAAKFAPGGGGEMAVPTTQAFKKCVQRFKTVLVDEFRSTMVNAGDGTIMKMVESKRKNAEVRGLMWCGSTNNGKFVNRDLNAALNIRRCLALPTRPLELCRLGQPKIRKEVGKVIRC